MLPLRSAPPTKAVATGDLQTLEKTLTVGVQQGFAAAILPRSGVKELPTCECQRRTQVRYRIRRFHPFRRATGPKPRPLSRKRLPSTCTRGWRIAPVIPRLRNVTPSPTFFPPLPSVTSRPATPNPLLAHAIPRIVENMCNPRNPTAGRRRHPGPIPPPPRWRPRKDPPVCVTKSLAIPATRSGTKIYPYPRNLPGSVFLRHNAPSPSESAPQSPGPQGRRWVGHVLSHNYQS